MAPNDHQATTIQVVYSGGCTSLTVDEADALETLGYIHRLGCGFGLALGVRPGELDGLRLSLDQARRGRPA